MSFPRYPKYKDSGVEWLGKVPEHWDVTPLKYVVRVRSGGTPRKENADYWNGAVPWASSKDLKAEAISSTQDHISQFALHDGAAELVPSGSVLIVVRGMILSHTFPVTKALVALAINQDLKALTPREMLEEPFLAWLLRGSARESLARTEEAAHGTKAIRMETWASMRLPIPSREEQISIAAFLDRETAKIDALVAEQRRLMELLKEKRQAVISHAVTKGLNPDAPMKDSGIEWLGEVPAHWEVGSLKRFWRVTDCKHVTAEFVDDGIPLASIREVQGRWVSLENAKRTTEEFYELLVEGGRFPLPGDLIFSRNATVGEIAQVPQNHPRFAMGQDVVLMRKRSQGYSSDYLQLVIRSAVVERQLANLMIGSTFKRINVEEICALIIPFPPVDEQVKISAYLTDRLDAFDALAAESQRAIDLLLERRTALISAAVTGQIDVRELAAESTSTEAAACAIA